MEVIVGELVVVKVVAVDGAFDVDEEIVVSDTF